MEKEKTKNKVGKTVLTASLAVITLAASFLLGRYSKKGDPELLEKLIRLSEECRILKKEKRQNTNLINRLLYRLSRLAAELEKEREKL